MLQRRSSVVLRALSIMALLCVVFGSVASATAQPGSAQAPTRPAGQPASTTPVAPKATRRSFERPVPVAPPLLSERPLAPDALAPASTSAFVKLTAEPYVSALVTLADAPLATYTGAIPGLAATSPRVTGHPLDLRAPASLAYLAYLNGQLDTLATELAADIPELRVSHRFDIVLGGLAVQVPRSLIERLALPTMVAAVLTDEPLAITGDPSPTGPPPALWVQLRDQGQSGEGMIIGILDSGITPETPTLADPDPAGWPFPPPRPPADGAAWPCDLTSGPNPGPAASCGNRLISAQRFLATYETVAGLQSDEYTSARDDSGHGTTIAALAAGSAAGIAPQAHLAAYKVCGTRGCFPSDVAAAIQQTVGEELDVLTLALGGANTAGITIIERALLDAYTAQSFVIAAGVDSASPDRPSPVRAAASAHAAGAAALLAKLYPHWSPGQIMTALLTTATLEQPAQDAGPILSDPEAPDPAAGPPSWSPDLAGVNLPRMPGLVTVARAITDTSGVSQRWRLSVSYAADQPRDLTIAVPSVIDVAPLASQSFPIMIDGRDVPLGQTRRASIQIASADGLQQLDLPVTFVREQGDLAVEQRCEPATIALGATTTCTISLTNLSGKATTVALLSQLPRQLQLVPASIVGGNPFGNDRVAFTGDLPAGQPASVSAEVRLGASPFGYVPLRLFLGSQALSLSDESFVNLSLDQATISLGGQSYTQLGVVSNGYLVLGGAAAADVSAINRALPNPTPPNNLLAPFWTDLDPGAGGRVLANTICTAGPACWLVVEYERVPNASDLSATNTFQVWMGLDRPNDISFVYGPELTLGNQSLLTVGAENAAGTSGMSLYVNGMGAPPTPTLPSGASTYEVRVTATAEQLAAHALTFQATGSLSGPFVSYSFVLSDVLDGVAITRVASEVQAAP